MYVPWPPLLCRAETYSHIVAGGQDAYAKYLVGQVEYVFPAAANSHDEVGEDVLDGLAEVGASAVEDSSAAETSSATALCVISCEVHIVFGEAFGVPLCFLRFSRAGSQLCVASW